MTNEEKEKLEAYREEVRNLSHDEFRKYIIALTELVFDLKARISGIEGFLWEQQTRLGGKTND